MTSIKNECLWDTVGTYGFDVSTFEDRCVDLRRSTIAVSTFGDRCVDLRRSMVDVSTFENRPSQIDDRLMCRSSKIDVLTFEHRWSM